MIDDIIQNIERFINLRRFKDEEFDQKVQQLHAFQSQRMSETYWVLLSDDTHAELLKFFLDDIYGGIDLYHLSDKLNKTAKLLDKLFTDLELVHLAIEFNTLTGELDEAITTQLFDVMGVTSITDENYREAFKQLDQLSLREQQLALIGRFAKESTDVINDPLIYSAFKLAKYPAKLGGLGSLHNLMSKGFKAMRRLPDTHEVISDVLDHELKLYQRIQEDSTTPFSAFSSTRSTQ